MTTAIIFDFGDVFINLEKEKCNSEFKKLNISLDNPTFEILNQKFEVAAISKDEYLSEIQKFSPTASIAQIQDAWNSLLGDFPEYRLDFLQMLSSKFRLFLLSNTDAIHIAHFEKKMGESFCAAFYQCFEKVYFSFEMKHRKPDPNAFQIIINNHQLQPKNTLFVDDKLDNILAAEKLGLKTWHLIPGTDDVINLLENKIS